VNKCSVVQTYKTRISKVNKCSVVRTYCGHDIGSVFNLGRSAATTCNDHGTAVVILPNQSHTGRFKYTDQILPHPGNALVVVTSQEQRRLGVARHVVGIQGEDTEQLPRLYMVGLHIVGIGRIYIVGHYVVDLDIVGIGRIFIVSH
jgi:hypothetical protein